MRKSYNLINYNEYNLQTIVLSSMIMEKNKRILYNISSSCNHSLLLKHDCQKDIKNI